MRTYPTFIETVDLEARAFGVALHDVPNGAGVEGLVLKPAAAAVERPEERRFLGSLGKTGCIDPLLNALGSLRVERGPDLPGGFLVEKDVVDALLVQQMVELDVDHGGTPAAGIEHDREDRAIADPAEGVRIRSIEELAGLGLARPGSILLKTQPNHVGWDLYRTIEEQERSMGVEAVLKEACNGVQGKLQEVGRRAAYLWEEDEGGVMCPGYSYDIPKEEQIRSALWANLHIKDKYASELEWNVYERTGRKTKITGEVDLVVFDWEAEGERAPRILVEVKRWFQLTGWRNGATDVGGDIVKLRRVRDRLIRACEGGGSILAAVFVVGFIDKGESQEAPDWLAEAAKSGEAEGHEIWREADCSEYEINDGEYREYLSRGDLLILK